MCKFLIYSIFFISYHSYSDDTIRTKNSFGLSYKIFEIPHKDYGIWNVHELVTLSFINKTNDFFHLSSSISFSNGESVNSSSIFFDDNGRGYTTNFDSIYNYGGHIHGIVYLPELTDYYVTPYIKGGVSLDSFELTKSVTSSNPSFYPTQNDQIQNGFVASLETGFGVRIKLKDMGFITFDKGWIFNSQEYQPQTFLLGLHFNI